VTSASLLTLIPALIRQPLEVDALAEWLPLKIKQGMYGLYFNPPAPALHRFSNQIGIITRMYDILIAILNVGILKRYLALRLCFLQRFFAACHLCRLTRNNLLLFWLGVCLLLLHLVMMVLS
jgi:hypothetical protein